MREKICIAIVLSVGSLLHLRPCPAQTTRPAEWLDDAKAQLDKLPAGDPERLDALVELVRLEARVGDKAAAGKIAAEVASTPPSPAKVFPANQALYVWLAIGDLDKAEGAARPGGWMDWQSVAVARVEAGKLEAAKADLLKLTNGDRDGAAGAISNALAAADNLAAANEMSPEHRLYPYPFELAKSGHDAEARKAAEGWPLLLKPTAFIRTADAQLDGGRLEAAGKSVHLAFLAISEVKANHEAAYHSFEDYCYLTEPLVRLGRQKQAIEVLTPHIEIAGHDLHDWRDDITLPLAIRLAQADDEHDARKVLEKLKAMDHPDPGPYPPRLPPQTLRDRALLAIACRRAFDGHSKEALATLKEFEVPADGHNPRAIYTLAINFGLFPSVAAADGLRSASTSPLERAWIDLGVATGLTTKQHDLPIMPDEREWE